MTVGVLDTPFGAITVRTTALGVARIDFGVHRELLEPSTPGADSHLAIACEQLTEYLAGTRQHFSVELDRSGRFGFRGEVLAALELVPFGEVWRRTTDMKAQTALNFYRELMAAGKITQ